MDIERLLTDLTTLPGLVWIVGPGPVVSENTPKGIKPPRIKDGVATIEAESWHFHLPLKSVTGVEFIEQEGGFDGRAPRTYLVRFNGEGGASPLRCYFPSPWQDDAGQPSALQRHKLAAFEGLRDRHAGQDGITFVRKVKQPATP